MRKSVLGLGIFAIILPTLAVSQPIVKTPESPYPPSAINRPYWADKPMIEIIGRANGEFDANRATLNFSIKEINSDSQKALVKLNDKSRPAIEALQKLIGKSGDIEVTYQLTPIYQQYKDSDGIKVSNQREDKVENYVARYQFRVVLYDVYLAPKVKAEILAIKDAEMSGQPYYSFEPTIEQTRKVFALALEDGKERAKMVANTYGSKLKLLTFGEGQDDCKSYASTTNATVQVDNYDRSYAYAPPPPPPPVMAPAPMFGASAKPAIIASDLILPSAPAKNKLSASVCMVFGIE